MSEQNAVDNIGKLLADNDKFVVVQPDNPDMDSVASAIALEQIFTHQGKDVRLYSAVEIPSYLSSVPGADRISNDMPNDFNLAIVVDTASDSLVAKLGEKGHRPWLASRPLIIIDHHQTKPTIDYADVIHNPPAAATGEVIYELAMQLSWKLNDLAVKLLAMAILSDSQGLSSETTTARTVHIIAELVERGVNLSELENARRESLRREPELIAYKGLLLQRVQFHSGGRIATVDIPWEEIEKYSPLYNPSMLVIDDMRLAVGTDVAICFKLYRDGKITAKVRSNYGWPIAGQLAEHFGGGGHGYASGFKVTDGTSLDELKAKVIEEAASLLDQAAN